MIVRQDSLIAKGRPKYFAEEKKLIKLRQSITSNLPEHPVLQIPGGGCGIRRIGESLSLSGLGRVCRGNKIL